MGKKPVLGMVSALCVGLALTGCRDAGARSDGSLLSKGSSAPYRPQPVYGAAGPNAPSQAAGWNTSPPTAANTGMQNGGALTPASPPAAPTFGAAGVKPADPLLTGRTGQSGVQTTGMTAPPPPAPPVNSADFDAGPAKTSVPPGSAETSSRFPPAPIGEVHAVPGASAHVLPPPPPLTGSSMPPSLPEAPPPPTPVKPDMGPAPQLAPPPAPVAPGPTITPPSEPGALPPPPAPPPDLPPLPPPPAPPGPNG